MARARELRPQARTQLDTVRDNLAALERSLPNIRGMGQRAVDLLRQLAAVHDDLDRLRQHDRHVDLRSEETRLNYIEEQLRGDRMAPLVREIARTTGWESLRTEMGAEASAWWWHLDEELARRRWARGRYWLVRGVLIAVALAVVVAGYRLFLAPSPAVSRKVALSQDAEVAVERGDLDQAILLYQEAAAADPQDPEPQMWLGVLYRVTGQLAPSTDAFRAAREDSPSMYNYFLLRARIYLQLGMPNEAADDILAAMDINPDSDQALFLLGDALEKQGDYADAMSIFWVVSTQAQDPSLQVLAKMRYAMLLESGPRDTDLTPTPTVEGDGP